MKPPRRPCHKLPRAPKGLYADLAEKHDRLRFATQATMRREFLARRAVLAITTLAPDLPRLTRMEYQVLGEITDDAVIALAARALAGIRSAHWSRRLATAYDWVLASQDVEAERRSVAQNGAKDGPEGSDKVKTADPVPDAPSGQAGGPTSSP